MKKPPSDRQLLRSVDGGRADLEMSLVRELAKPGLQNLDKVAEISGRLRKRASLTLARSKSSKHE